MRILVCLYCLCFFSVIGNGQQLTLLTPLENALNETSGLLYINQRIITHNDSGGEPALYELDSLSGTILRTTVIENATNVDWEDICADDNYIYIGDFGNNSGTRTNLKIYKIALNDYLNPANDTVSATIINYSYADQTSFSSAPFFTNFDAEALIAYQDSLYVFTKNWGNGRTNIYALPKTPGTYSAFRRDSINVQGLVTGAAYNSASDRIVLSGYTITNPFIVEISLWQGNQFSSGLIERSVLQVPTGFSIQIEGIAFLGEHDCLLSAEEYLMTNSGLYQLNTNALSLKYQRKVRGVVYPNPATEEVTIKMSGFVSARVYDLNGVLLNTFLKPHFSLSEYPKGQYIIVMRNFRGKIIVKKLVLR